MVSRLTREHQLWHLRCFDGTTSKIPSLSMTCVGDQHGFRKKNQHIKIWNLGRAKIPIKNHQEQIWSQNAWHWLSVASHQKFCLVEEKNHFREFGSKAKKSVYARHISLNRCLEKSWFPTNLLETFFSWSFPKPMRPPDAQTFTIHLHFHFKSNSFLDLNTRSDFLENLGIRSPLNSFLFHLKNVADFQVKQL